MRTKTNSAEDVAEIQRCAESIAPLISRALQRFGSGVVTGALASHLGSVAYLALREGALRQGDIDLIDKAWLTIAIQGPSASN